MLGLIENSPRAHMNEAEPKAGRGHSDDHEAANSLESSAEQDREFERAIEEWKAFVHNLQI